MKWTHLFTVCSFLLLKVLLAAYGGGVVCLWMQDNPELAGLTAGLMGHFSGIALDWMNTRCAHAPSPKRLV